MNGQKHAISISQSGNRQCYQKEIISNAADMGKSVTKLRRVYGERAQKILMMDQSSCVTNHSYISGTQEGKKIIEFSLPRKLDSEATLGSNLLEYFCLNQLSICNG